MSQTLMQKYENDMPRARNSKPLAYSYINKYFLVFVIIFIKLTPAFADCEDRGMYKWCDGRETSFSDWKTKELEATLTDEQIYEVYLSPTYYLFRGLFNYTIVPLLVFAYLYFDITNYFTRLYARIMIKYNNWQEERRVRNIINSVLSAQSGSFRNFYTFPVSFTFVCSYLWDKLINIGDIQNSFSGATYYLTTAYTIFFSAWSSFFSVQAFFSTYIIARAITFYYNSKVVVQSNVNKLHFDFDGVDDSVSKIFESVDSKYINLAWHSYLFYYDISRAETKFDFIIATTRFVHQYYSVKDAYKVLSIVLSDGEQLEAHSGGLRDARKLLDKWDDLSNSELLLKTTRVYKSLLFSGLTSIFSLPFNRESLDLILLKSSSCNGFSSPNQMCYSIVELIVTFCETGYECFMDKSLQPLLIRDRATRDWMNDFTGCINEINTIPINEDYDVNILMEKLRCTLGRGTALMKYNSKMIQPLWRQLNDKYLHLIKTNNVNSLRKPPFSVLIHGPPGIGKSTVTQLVGTIYHRTVKDKGIYDLSWDPKVNMYTYNSDDQYWSNYQGATQWFVCFDDLARETPHIIAAGKTNSLNDVITTVNTVGIATTQAAIEDKGCIPLIPKLVVATTNTKSLNASCAVACPAAVLRRFPFVIKPILKRDYLDPITGTMCKMDKVVHDAWEYEIETYGVANEEGKLISKYTPYHPDNTSRTLCTGAELSVFLRNKILAHEKASSVMMESVKVSDSVTMCEHGVVNYFSCQHCCVSKSPIEPQSWFSSPQPTKLSLMEKIYHGALNYAHDNCSDKVYMRAVEFTIMTRNDAVPLLVKNGLYRLINNNPETITKLRTAFRAACVVASGAILYSVFSNIVKPSKKKGKESDLTAFSNIWAKNDSLPFQVPSKSISNYSHLTNTIKKSMFRLRVNIDKPYSDTVTCVSLKPGLFLTVSHPFLSGEKWRCKADYGLSQHHVSSKQGFTLLKSDCHFLDNDLVVFHAILLPRKNLLSFLPKEIDKNGRNGFLVNMSADGQIEHGTTRTIMMINDAYTYRGNKITGNFMNGERLDRKPVPGDCGTIMISESSGCYFISGMHCAGNTETGRIVYSQLSQSIFNFEEPLLALSGVSDKPYYSYKVSRNGPLSKPFHKGPHTWVDKCEGVILGSFPGGVSPTSSVTRTDVCEDVCKEFNYKLNCGKPLMRATINGNGEWVNPWTISVKAQGEISSLFHHDDVMKCATSFVTETVRDNRWLENVANKSTDIAINGEQGNTYINHLPMTTSGGFYFPGSKRQYFEGEPGSYVMGPEVQASYDHIKSCYLNGERAEIIFNGALKDEPRPFEKIREGKTRVFTSSDVAFSIIVREQYLGVTQAIMENNFVTECAVGMNPYQQWDALGRYLTTFGDERLVAGDYKNYDKKMPAVFIRAAFWVLDSWRTVLAPLTHEDKLISRGVATDTAFPIINMNKDLFQFFGSNPSGHPLTTVVNSISNSLFMRFCYLKLGYNLSNFKDNVKLMTLGDDNIFGSNKDGFNHSTVSHVLGQFGVPYTMADKKSESVPFISLRDCDFLKRKFPKLNGQYVGALDLKSTLKSLCIWVESKHITSSKQTAASYLAARIEWAFHGEDIFNNCTSKMERILSNPKHMHIRDYFTKRHYYDWSTTLRWMQNTLIDDEDDDTPLILTLDSHSLNRMGELLTF